MYPGEDGTLGQAWGGLLVIYCNAIIDHFIQNISLSHTKKLLAKLLPIFFFLLPIYTLKYLERDFLVYTESHVLYDPTYVKYSQKVNPWRQKEDQCLTGAEHGNRDEL